MAHREDGEGYEVAHREEMEVAHRGQEVAHRGQEVAHRGQEVAHWGQEVAHREEVEGHEVAHREEVGEGQEDLGALGHSHPSQRHQVHGAGGPACERK